MADYRKQEVVSGALIIVCGVLVFALVASVVNWRNWFRDTTMYEAVFSDVLGVGIGTPVVMRGLDYGSVVNLRYERHPGADGEIVDVVLLSLRVRADVPLHQGARVTIEAPSLLEDFIVVVHQGDKRMPVLAEGSRIPGQPVTPFSALVSGSSDFLSNAQKLLSDDNSRRVSNILSEFEALAKRARVLVDDFAVDVAEITDDQVKPMAGDLRAFAGDIRAVGGKAYNAAGQVNDILDSASQTVKRIEQRVSGLADALDGLAGKLQVAADDLHVLLTDADGLVRAASPEVTRTLVTAREQFVRLVDQTVAVREELGVLLDEANQLVTHNAADVERTVDNIRRISEHVEELTRELKRRPWRLIWKSEARREAPPPEIEWLLNHPDGPAFENP